MLKTYNFYFIITLLEVLNFQLCKKLQYLNLAYIYSTII